MEKRIYDAPEMEIIELEQDDVITASNTNPGDNDTEWPFG